MFAQSKRRKLIGIALIYILLSIGGVTMVMPFMWMLSTSFKCPGGIYTIHPKFIADKPTLENYYRVWFEQCGGLFPRYFLNSFIVAGSVTLLTLFFCSLAGYVYAKRRFPGRDLSFLLIVSTLMVPGVVTLIPAYKVIIKLGLTDTYSAMILPFASSAFGIFLMRQHIKTIPTELIDAARIDGCSQWQIYVSIVLPLIKPVLAALAILTFLGQWDNLLWQYIVIDSAEMRTIAVGMTYLLTNRGSQYTLMMAASSLSVIPVLLVFCVLQRYFIEGLTLGSVKG